MHDDAYIDGHSENNIKRVIYITISGERTEQLDIFCRVTGFKSDFLSFIDVELIRFFHGALQLTVNNPVRLWCLSGRTGISGKLAYSQNILVLSSNHLI